MRAWKSLAAVSAVGLLLQSADVQACRVAPADPESCGVTSARRQLAAASPTERVVGLIEATVGENNRRSSTGEPVTAIPAGTILRGIDFPETKVNGDPEHVKIYLEFPEDVVASGELTSYRIAQIGYEFVHALTEENVSGYYLRIYDSKSGNWLSPDEFCPAEEPPAYVPEVDLATIEMANQLGIEISESSRRNLPVINPGQPSGSLSNRTVFINQSHGWFDDFTWVGDRWRVQRTNTCDLMEDFSSAEFINLYVLPMLRNAGAKVMTVRESDHQTNMVIVDNSDTATGLTNGRYVESGTWSTSTIEGFKQKTTSSWSGTSINPFSQGTGQNRLSSGVTTGSATATATWTAVIPASGYYNVYASWSPFSGRANDAQYLVHHSGGISEVRVNQKIDGYTWFLLGNWYFEAGAPESERKVVLTNVSNDGTAVNVSADAIRWGGGMGDVARHENGVSGRPRWEEEAVIYLQYNGFGRSGLLYTGDDDEEGGWADRPQYARWEHSIKDGSVEDAVYIAWHTNAFNGTSGNCDGTARGLSSFRHSNASTASETLQTIMHDKMYAAINTTWFTSETWQVRSKNVTDFGENNQTNMGSGLPGMLLEGLFHDNSADGNAYNEPQFRYIAARAFMHGLIDYFNDRDTTTLPYPPEPPINFRAETLGGGQVQLTWSAGPTGGHNGAAATSYKVYTSKNGFGFDDGVAVAGTTTTISSVPTNEVRYFRVAAVNAGGQSFPTETLAASGGGNATKVLIVNGFDRNQRTLVPRVTITNVGTVRRLDPRTFQAFNYVVEHGEAIESAGYQVSSSSNEPVAAGTVSLTPYDLVIWIAGEESTTDDALSATERTRLESYLTAGKSLFISGAEIGWDLGRSGVSSAAELAFYNNILKTAYVTDSAGTYNVAGSAGGPYASLGTINFSTGSGARYDAETSDRIGTSNGSTVVMTYSGGSGGNAAVAYPGGVSDGKVISLGFPFETIATAANRQAVMQGALNYFFGATGFDGQEWMLY